MKYGNKSKQCGDLAEHYAYSTRAPRTRPTTIVIVYIVQTSESGIRVPIHTKMFILGGGMRFKIVWNRSYDEILGIRVTSILKNWLNLVFS